MPPSSCNYCIIHFNLDHIIIITFTSQPDHVIITSYPFHPDYVMGYVIYIPFSYYCVRCSPFKQASNVSSPVHPDHFYCVVQQTFSRNSCCAFCYVGNASNHDIFSDQIEDSLITKISR